MKSSTRSQRNARFKTVRRQAPDRPTLRLGDTDIAVNDLQSRLGEFVPAIVIGGDFGPRTHHAVCRFQYRMFLTEDGIVGPLTWDALFAKSPVKTPVLQVGSRSGEVRELQKILIRLGVYRSVGYQGVADGLFGPITREAVRRYQSDRHLQDTDGIVGRFTWAKLAGDRLWAEGYPINRIELRNRRKGHTGEITAIATAKESPFVFTGSADTLVQRWSATGDRASAPDLGDRGAVSDVVVTPDTTDIISSTDGGTIRTTNFRQTTRRSFPGRGRRVSTVDISPGGQLIAAGNFDKSVRIFNRTGGLEAQRTVHEESVAAVRFNPRKSRFDGQLVSIDRAQQLVLWKGAHDVGTPMLTPTVLADGERLIRKPAIAISNSGYLIAATGAQRLRVFSALGSLLYERDYGVVINAVAFSPCNRYLALGCSDRTIHVIDLWVDSASQSNGFSPTYVLEGHRDSVSAVAFARDSAALYSGDESGELLTWEIKR